MAAVGRPYVKIYIKAEILQNIQLNVLTVYLAQVDC